MIKYVLVKETNYCAKANPSIGISYQPSIIILINPLMKPKTYIKLYIKHSTGAFATTSC